MEILVRNKESISYSQPVNPIPYSLYPPPLRPPPLWFFKDISTCETFFLPKLPCKLVLRMNLYFWKFSKPKLPYFLTSNDLVT